MDILSKTRRGWTAGSTASLEIRALSDFVASSGEVVKKGHYKTVTCSVVGELLTIPLITSIPPTTDATPNSAMWQAVLRGLKGRKIEDWVAAFSLSHVTVSPADWADIIISNSPPQPQPRPPGINYDEAVLLLKRYLGELRLASMGSHGEVETDVEPADTARPIVVGGNSPRIAQSFGTATLVAGEAKTISDSGVALTSPVLPISISEGITGRLRSLNHIAGVSFDVVSDNGADAGDFRWFRY